MPAARKTPKTLLSSLIELKELMSEQRKQAVELAAKDRHGVAVIYFAKGEHLALLVARREGGKTKQRLYLAQILEVDKASPSPLTSLKELMSEQRKQAEELAAKDRHGVAVMYFAKGDHLALLVARREGGKTKQRLYLAQILEVEDTEQ